MNTNFLADIYYPSESDEPLEWFELNECHSFPLTPSNIGTLFKKNTETPIVEVSVDEFWLPLTKTEEWYDEVQIEQAQKSEALKTEAEANLTNCQAFRIGELEIELLLVGSNAQGYIAGIKTLLIES